MPEACYHCGEPVPDRVTRRVHVNGADRAFCCPGCEAVAQLLAGEGLEAFYRFREAPAPRPAETPPDWALWDEPALQERHVRAVDGAENEIVLGIEGLTCAACCWLIEQSATRLDGVTRAEVNPASARMLLRWQPERIRLSGVLDHLARLGFRPHAVAAADDRASMTRERHAALRRLALAGLGMMQVMMYAGALYSGLLHADMDPAMRDFLRVVSLLVTTPVLLYSGQPFLVGAWRDLRAGRPGMDVPISVALLVAFSASLWNTARGGGEVYFDSVTMFIFFLTVARFLEMLARHRARQGLEGVARLLPATARRINPHGESVIDIEALKVGDRVRVPLGETVPVDGIVCEGESHVDEAMVTGEFDPPARRPGDRVLAGTSNVGAPLVVEVTGTGEDTLAAGMVRLLERARAERPPLVALADRIATRFVTVVLIAAAATAAVWSIIEPDRALEVTLAVLVVTCPCALSLATPTAVVAATRRLAEAGLLVARPAALEALAGIDTLLMDKTGTLTQGRFSLVDCDVADGWDRQRAGAAAAALEAGSAHPIAAAFRPFRDGTAARDVREHPGRGIAGVVGGRPLRLGRADWATDTIGAERNDLVLASAEGVIARFRLVDRPRADAAETITAARRLGLEPTIASGDAEAAVRDLADRLGITHAEGRLRPEDKLARVEALRADGRRVAVVGDGVNDAAVLAAADAGIAMGSGSAITRTSADFIVPGERLAPIVAGITEARHVLRVIRQNTGWALAYNGVGLSLAVFGLVPPWAAALGMSASSLVVVANALRRPGTIRRRAGATARQDNRYREAAA